MDRYATAVRCMAAVTATLVTTGCWNLSGLGGPAFRSLLVGSKVWLEASSVNALPAGSRMELDPALLGRWNELGQPTTAWTFEATADGDYAVHFGSGGYSALFEGTLHRVGDDTFLDLATIAFPEASPADETDASAAEAGEENTAETPRRIHAFFKLTIDGNVARLEGINGERTRELITSGELELAHNPSVGFGVHITAPGEEIEAFLRRFANDPAVIGLENGFELQR